MEKREKDPSPITQPRSDKGKASSAKQNAQPETDVVPVKKWLGSYNTRPRVFTCPFVQKLFRFLLSLDRRDSLRGSSESARSFLRVTACQLCAWWSAGTPGLRDASTKRPVCVSGGVFFYSPVLALFVERRVLFAVCAPLSVCFEGFTVVSSSSRWPATSDAGGLLAYPPEVNAHASERHGRVAGNSSSAVPKLHQLLLLFRGELASVSAWQQSSLSNSRVSSSQQPGSVTVLHWPRS